MFNQFSKWIGILCFGVLGLTGCELTTNSAPSDDMIIEAVYEEFPQIHDVLFKIVGDVEVTNKLAIDKENSHYRAYVEFDVEALESTVELSQRTAAGRAALMMGMLVGTMKGDAIAAQGLNNENYDLYEKVTQYEQFYPTVEKGQIYRFERTYDWRKGSKTWIYEVVE